MKKKYNEFIKFIKKEVDSGSFFKGLDKKNGSEFDLICLLGHRLYIIEPDANRADQVAKNIFRVWLCFTSKTISIMKFIIFRIVTKVTKEIIE
ncbi:MAG: hypothetical protein IPJ66_10600 [Bacteroidetes bacterium]|nr:hypothetical protein [Bacteroidota bacterium]